MGLAASTLSPRVLACISGELEAKRRAAVGKTYRPLADRVVVKPIEREETTKSGIVLPDTVRERPQEGTVIAVGPGRIDDSGKRIPMEVEVEDVVIYSKFAGTELEKDTEDEILLLRESDILATVVS